jgi:hypothetical protein
MTSIQICLDGDQCWPDLTALGEAGKVHTAQLAAVALLPDGEVKRLDGSIGRVPIVTLRIALPDGQVALAQVKLDTLEQVVRAMRGRLDYLREMAATGGVPS